MLVCPKRHGVGVQSWLVIPSPRVCVCVCLCRGPRAAPLLPDVVLAAQQRLQLGPQRAVLPLELLACLLLLLQGPGSGTASGPRVRGLGLSPLSLLHTARRTLARLLLRQELQE